MVKTHKYEEEKIRKHKNEKMFKTQNCENGQKAKM